MLTDDAAPIDDASQVEAVKIPGAVVEDARAAVAVYGLEADISEEDALGALSALNLGERGRCRAGQD